MVVVTPYLMVSAGSSDPDSLLNELSVGHGKLHQVAAQHGPVPHQPLQAGLGTSSSSTVQF